jgi:ATP-dependent helicase/nuclease subunit B
VEQALEQAAYMPTPAIDPDVVITPLARTVLRPFGAVVFAGCDERFGASATAALPWPTAIAQTHGLPHDAQRRERERAAFVQLLRQPQVVLLRRLSHAGEPLSASRLIELAQSARRRLGQPPIVEQEAALRMQAVPPRTVLRPTPCAASPEAIPDRWSASLVETLRICPYRFFSRAVLRLGEPVELDLDWQKRDHGDWLHKVLYRFHEARPAARAPEDDVAALQAAAHAETQAATSRQDRDIADLLPFEAGFAGFAKHYIDWLHERDALGWRYAQGEVPRERALPGLAPVAMLSGRIDRIDTHDEQGLQVIDYKTGRAGELKKRVREPFEDTQLAAYAALMQADDQAPLAEPLRASYLALDDRQAPIVVEYPNVEHSARVLMAQLPSEVARLRQGAPMPALGEGKVCELCEARGLCRRDHWAPLA